MATLKMLNVRIYSNLWEKTKGLIGESEPESFGQGIALPGVNSIHTFFVGYPIDLVFLNSDGKVIRLVEKLKPFRFSPIVLKAKTTIELKSGSIRNLKIKVGDLLTF